MRTAVLIFLSYHFSLQLSNVQDLLEDPTWVWVPQILLKLHFRMGQKSNLSVMSATSLLQALEPSLALLALGVLPHWHARVNISLFCLISSGFFLPNTTSPHGTLTGHKLDRWHSFFFYDAALTFPIRSDFCFCSWTKVNTFSAIDFTNENNCKCWPIIPRPLKDPSW